MQTEVGMFELAVIGTLYLIMCYGTVLYWMWDCPPVGIEDWLAALSVLVAAPISVPVIEFLKDRQQGL